MATVGTTPSRTDRFDGSSSDDSTSPRDFHSRLSSSPRHAPHLDEVALYHSKQQYLNNGMHDNNDLENPIDDLSQFPDPVLEPYDRDNSDMDDGEIHFDNGTNFDYEVSIKERLKKANQEFEHDDTSIKLEHKQRVSFDARVKAVDIVQDPQEYSTNVDTTKPPITPVSEESSSDLLISRNTDNPHQYTVPLNDTQPREGPTLLENIKAVQFHGQPLIGRHQPHNPNAASASSNHEDDSKLKSSDTNNNTHDDKNSNEKEKSTNLSKNSMVVAINGEFKLQAEDDYTATRSTKNPPNKLSDDDDDEDDSTENNSNKNVPKSSTEDKPNDSLNPELNRLRLSDDRPKSSESRDRRRDSNDSTSNSFSYNNNSSSSKNDQRPKSAIVLKSTESTKRPQKYEKSFYDELRQQAAEKRRAELQEQHRKKEETEKERKEKLAKAKESFEQWVRDKDAERRRINEEKRLEEDERNKREKENEKTIEELGRKKYQEWLERKDHEAKMANEYRKLQDEEAATFGGSTSSINNHSKKENDRAFRRWLRRKYEQAREENRRIEIETRRVRRRQRRSIKRFQLHQDLQLAKSFGYS